MGETLSENTTTLDPVGFDPTQGLQFGMYSLGDHLPNPADGSRVSAGERIREFVGYAQAAEEAGFDFFSVGESHQEFFASQAHAVILGAIAQATSTIRIGSTSTILSTSDPVRVFENFATIDHLSEGRAELVAGRASRIGLFELLGYDLRDYEELFEEKFDLLNTINREESVTWSGQFRAPLNNAEVLPRPEQNPLPIWRAVGGAPASAVKAGLAGVPMVMAHLGGTTSSFKPTVDAYRQAARHAGFDPAGLPIATAGFLYTAPTSQEALQGLYPHINEGMKRTNGQGMPKQLFAQSVDPASIVNIGSPQQVVEKILHQHEVFGHQRYLGQIDFGGMPYERVMKQIETIGSEIIPAVKKYTATKEAA
ncbi:LLM class flavin-dependent oxidoreductase [Brevibacterium casei]|uniref:Alkanal monooxygenase alpha chain n=1 Tax=Brevibacterium casei TaxID=33889 RepID=A0A165EHK2_9MICO|nr:luciferase [Brevibacterium casei]MBE4693458.1 LLM class flavin-dependent oxidoreductase [Brevibacterium casei]MBY3576581.1 LLM class flavin-dependent oxidoreductase [Brevibacterium casei]PAK95334.1 LLM class flavin-dependent oxidoreductase [Brevibacterium casei]QZE25228.1 LLM class flavin-dependent oxidoreductase [Brevibacterium casei]